MEGLEIPEELRARLMAHLGVSAEHIDQAVASAEGPTVGVTPFLQHMRKVSARLSSPELFAIAN